MKSKGKKIGFIIAILVVVLSIGGYFGVKYLLDKDLEKQQKELQQIKEEYGFVEKENVTTSVAKFNTQVMDNNVSIPASIDASSAENERYYYALLEDIVLVVVPEKYTENRDEDIVKSVSIYFNKNSQNEEVALEYVKSLIRANANKELSEEEITKFMEEAKQLSVKEMAKNGSGITLGYIEDEERMEYYLNRVYEED